MGSNPASGNASIKENADLVIDVEDVERDLAFRPVLPVDVSVRDFSLEIDLAPHSLSKALGGTHRSKENAKPILENVIAHMPSGAVTAILGASGSGKTSLLNSLSHRVEGGALRSQGQILYNQSPELRSISSGYLIQQDVLIPTLTVHETLTYAAELRLPPPTTALERRQIVQDVIMELGLKDCANTKIGSNAQKGCSGGEKRRTSLAVQMLANPSVLFLDEATTGLDSTTAYQLVKTLRSLAHKGRTVIMTIHQPRSEIWSLFDNVILLARGATVYSGSRDRCLPYFKQLGHRLPDFMNPAEHLIDLAAIDNRSPEAESLSLAHVQRLVVHWKERYAKGDKLKHVEFSSESQSNGAKSSQHHAGFLRQLVVLTKRTFKVTWRDPYGMAGSLFESTVMALLAGLIWLQTDESLQGIRSREGAIFTASALQSYLVMLYEVYRLTFDIQTFDREHGEGVIGVPAWLLSRRFARLLLEDIPVPLLFTIIFYFLVGFRPIAQQFFVFFAVILVTHHIAINVATVSIALSRNFAIAVMIANILFTIQSLGGGYFVQAEQMAVWIGWIRWIAYSFYAYSAAAINEFLDHTSDPAGQLYACPYDGGTSNPACAPWTGTYVMKILEIPFRNIRTPFMILLAFLMGFFLVSGLVLTLLKHRMGISKIIEGATDLAAGKEKLADPIVGANQRITIQLNDLDFALHQRKSNFWQIKEVRILKPIRATFPPEQLNVIMGPSGSGKTSLLNLMAHRMHDSLSSKILTNGRMTFNNALPTHQLVRSICSYVIQDDFQLLPYLTVRENLHFAAQLRLPMHLTRRQKINKAESVLIKLGLRDCADNIVGSEFKKGISGGEKRRTTIAVQILTDPKVLFLDEPTSGLDAFTASSIIEVLRGLAKEGRTLVLTIHQTRSDLFKYFDSITLLAQGGSLIYTGEGSKMLPYFASLGFACPRTTNPADFALDTISVNLQSAAREAITRQKVNSMIVSWTEREKLEHMMNDSLAHAAELSSFERKMTSTRKALPVLMRRSFVNFKRNKNAVIARTSQVFSYGAILALFFSPLGNDLASVNARLGFVQQFSPLYFVGMLQNIAVYPEERDVFYREHEDNAYSIEAFFLQYTLAEIPFEIFTALIFAVLVDLAAQLPRTPSLFFIVAFNCFAIVNCGESLGIMFNTLFNHTGFAENVTSTFISVATMMGGVMSLDIPDFLQAFNHLSPVKWALGNLAPYTLRGVTFTCDKDQRLPNGRCPIETGEDVLREYNFQTNARLNILALGITVIAYRLVAYLVLKLKRTRWDLVKKKSLK